MTNTDTAQRQRRHLRRCGLLPERDAIQFQRQLRHQMPVEAQPAFDAVREARERLRLVWLAIDQPWADRPVDLCERDAGLQQAAQQLRAVLQANGRHDVIVDARGIVGPQKSNGPRTEVLSPEKPNETTDYRPSQ